MGQKGGQRRGVLLRDAYRGPGDGVSKHRGLEGMANDAAVVPEDFPAEPRSLASTLLFQHGLDVLGLPVARLPMHVARVKLGLAGLLRDPVHLLLDVLLQPAPAGHLHVDGGVREGVRTTVVGDDAVKLLTERPDVGERDLDVGVGAAAGTDRVREQAICSACSALAFCAAADSSSLCAMRWIRSNFCVSVA